MSPVAGRGWAALGVAAGLGAWQLTAAKVGPLLLAAPTDVVASLFTERGRLLEATFQTGLGALGGLGVAITLGVGLAVAAWWSDVLRLTLLPWTVLLQVIPIVAIAPLLVVWLGYGTPVALTTATIAAFYPIYSATTTGLVAPSADLVDLLRLYRAPRWRELLDLRLPAALPSFFAGLRTAAGLAVIGGIVGEFVGSNGLPPTLGQLVVYSARSARTDLCFAAIACAGALALTLHRLIGVAERRWIARWYGA